MANAGTASFSCPAVGGSSPYRLLVYNGVSDGIGRTSSAVVRVDGTPVLGPAAFDQQVGAAATLIALTAVSSIEVAVADGGGLRLEVVDEGEACSILAPSDVSAAGFQATLLSANAFPVPEIQLFNGGLEGAQRTNKGEVRFDGSLLVSRNDFREKVTAVLSPLTLGSPSVLSARAGEKGIFAVQVVDRDDTPPRFIVDVPADGSFTNRAQLVVSGTIDDPSAVVKVNGAPASVAAERFTGEAQLGPCWNTITVEAKDACSNASAASIRVGLDAIPPVVAVVAPASGLLTNRATQHVLVRYSDDFSGVDTSSVRVSLDGADVTGHLAIGPDAAEGDLTLPEGAHTIRVRLADRAGNEAAAGSSFTVDVTAPTVAIVAPADGSAGNVSPVAITLTYGDALSGVDLATLAVSLDGQDVTRSFAAGPVSAAASLALAAGTHQLELSVADLAGNAATTRSSFGVKGVDSGPPDPARIAPPTDPTVPTDIASATAFLYTGSSPIQTGVPDGTIEPQRVAVVRGRVIDRERSPLGGVKITVLGHPEFGSTLTRADGMFDMAVNGGGLQTLNYQKDGFLTVQRQVQAPWRDYAWAEPVVLVTYDTVTSTIQAGASAMQVARGSPVTDDDGTRQATVLFPSGTGVVMSLPDGSSVNLGAFHVRATEYTVGSTGRAAMPAALPPSSAYTYAVELSIDEAVMAGAQVVTFSQPVPVYLENFLGIPVGAAVPAGYYDRQRAVWGPSDDGVVVKVLSTAGGIASIDTNGDGVAETSATLSVLGVTMDELRRLATLYQTGQTLWRVPVPHFSTWDFNYNWGCEADSDGETCAPPKGDPPQIAGGPHPDPTTTCGSIIECENQGLGEEADVVGTPFRLSYRSTRQLGRKAERMVTVKLPTKVSSKALGFAYEVFVAGQRLTQRVTRTEQGTITYTWDGRDAYGRPYQGSAPVLVKTGFIYRPLYMGNSYAGRNGRTFGGVNHGSVSSALGWPLARFDNCVDPVNCLPPDGDPVLAGEFVAWNIWRGSLNSWTALPEGLGGWTLSAHHTYDPVAKVVRRGDGTTQAASIFSPSVMSTFARLTDWTGGTGQWLGGAGIAFAPDGSVYTNAWSSYSNHWEVRKIDPSGHSMRIAGGVPCQAPQSGIPATQACLGQIHDISLGQDGSIYLAGCLLHDSYNGSRASPVRRIRPDGIIEDFAGVPRFDYSAMPLGDEGPALQARVGCTSGVAAAPDGSVYILEGCRIRKVTPDGIIHAFAGNGTCGHSGDGGPAPGAQIGLNSYDKIALGPDGSVYLAEESYSVIRRISPDGTIETFAGTTPGFSGDGGSARMAQLYWPYGVSVGPDGSVYVSDTYNGRIRRVSPAGIIETVAGSGQYGYAGDGGPASAAQLSRPLHAVVGPSGDLYIADGDNRAVRRVGAPLPGFTLAEFVVASDDETGLYVFTTYGRHLRTLDRRTNGIIYSFGYDDSGRLASVRDRDGLVTTIERQGDVPSAIVAPHGQRTALSVDGNGYLSAITNPAGEPLSYTYDVNGLMQTFTDPRSNVHTFRYDNLGRLFRDENPAGGSKQLVRTDRADGYLVSVTTALGRSTLHDVKRLGTGDEVRTLTQPDGTATVRTEYTSGTERTARADGTVTAVTFGPDPQFGMQSPLAASSQITTPAGVQRSTSQTASIALTDPGNVLSVKTRTDEETVNGRTTRTTYDAITRGLTTVSPAGRTASATLDDKGRVTRLAPPGVLPLTFEYDWKGRLWKTTQGARTSTVDYDPSGFVRSVTDPVSRTTSFAYDPAGRVLTQALPGSRMVGFGYDPSGNMTSVVPPGRPAHGFGYTSIDQVRSYDPPPVAGSGSTSTTYDHDADGEILRELFPDAESLVVTWETGPDGKPTGRPAAVTTAFGTTGIGYDAAGRLETIAAPSVALGYGYDGFLTMSETWAGEVSGSVGYAYDTDFRVSGVTVAGASTARSYDADGLLTGAGALVIGRETVTGRVSGSTLGAVTTSQTYDSYGALATFSASVSGVERYRYELTPDGLGRIASKKETIGGATHTTDYGYDDAGRLWTVHRDGGLTAAYEYDPNGNRQRKVAGGTAEEASYDDQDRLLRHGGATYTWRPNGELESRTAAGQTTWYSYDRLGNLRQVALPDGRAIEYVVDGRNRRVGKKVNGTLVEGFLYEGQLRPVAWLDGTGAVRARFVYGARVNVPEYMVTASGTFRILTDHLGSPRLVVNASTGVLVERIDYDEWGRVLADTNPGFQPFGFAGGLYDRDTGLVRFGARDYDPQTGRWTNKDPVRFVGGLNLYLYAAGDPVNWIDPSGLYPGQMPPLPPEYSWWTWRIGQFDTGRWFLGAPDGRIFIAHPEDKGHWRHWDIQKPGGGDGGMWPGNAKKPWPGQKKPKPDQCSTDPSGDAPGWEPPPGNPLYEGGAPDDPAVPFLPLPMPMPIPAPAPAPIPVFVW